jgi:CubicO group peptidase (beta-lactamase class C family)
MALKLDDALKLALERGELGVAVAAYVGNDLVVDRWVGVADESDHRAVERDTLFPIFSVTKAMTSAALHLQAERGCVDYDQPVAVYWPEFEQAGKGEIKVRHVLTHQSGAAAMPPEVTPRLLADWDWLTSQIARLAPLHRPGEKNLYHSMTFGWIIGEIVRRTDTLHRLPCQFLSDEIFAPFEIEDIWLPLPAEEDARVATLSLTGAALQDFSGAPMREPAMPARIAPIPDIYNDPQLRRACNPSAGAIATARAVARFFAILANGGTLDGKRLLSEDRIRECLTIRPDNDRIDEVVGGPTTVGIGGFWLRHPALRSEPVLGSSRTILYQGGAGGSIAFADLDRRLAVAICHNRMFAGLGADEHPFVELADAIRDAVS